VKAGLGDNVHLNGGVTARVVHGTSVDLRDRHVFESGLNYSVKKKEEEKEEPG
jgi:hypothetical protein